MQKNTGSRKKNGANGGAGTPMDPEKVSAALRELATESGLGDAEITIDTDRHHSLQIGGPGRQR